MNQVECECGVWTERRPCRNCLEEKVVQQATEIERLQTLVKEQRRTNTDQHDDLKRLREERKRALIKVDGVDYRVGHCRDNTTPDELRDIVFGLALKIEELRAIVNKRHTIRMIADRDRDVYDGKTRSWVTWELPDHKHGNVTSVNTILDCLGIVPEDRECFDLSMERAVEAPEAKGA